MNFSSPLSTLSTETFVSHYQLDRQKGTFPYFLLYMKVVEIIHLRVVNQLDNSHFYQNKESLQGSDFLPSRGPDLGAALKGELTNVIE